MAAAEFEADHGGGEGESVVDVLCWADAVLHADIGLIEDVPAAEVPGTGLADGEVEFELAYAEIDGVGWELDEAAEVVEFEPRIAESSVGVCTGDADVVVNPEGDSAAEVAGGEDAEESRLEVGLGDEGADGAGGQGQVEVVAIGADLLVVGVVTEADGWQAWNDAGINGVGPEVGLGGSAEHDGRRLEVGVVIFGEFEACILECFAEVVELGKVDVAGGAGGSILSGKGWYCVTGCW